MGVPEAAEVLGVCRSEVYSLMTEGVVPFLKIGRRRLLPRAGLERFLASRLLAAN